MKINFLVTGLTALVPLILGFIWYNNKTFGNAWMQASGMTPEKAKNGNMVKILGLTVLFGFFLSMAINFMVIHQFHFFSILMNEPGLKEPGSELNNYANDFMTKYGNNFRTFKHGVFHGTIGALLIALPVISINALFEQRSFKYVAIHVGYWTVTIALMGGLICAFS